MKITDPGWRVAPIAPPVRGKPNWMTRWRDPEDDPRALIESLAAIPGHGAVQQLKQLADVSFDGIA